VIDACLSSRSEKRCGRRLQPVLENQRTIDEKLAAWTDTANKGPEKIKSY